MAMYNQKFVTAIKVGGKVLREFKDSILIPFGSEYSILVKNLNSVRSLVNIQIDGTDVCPGGLVVNANSEIDLERFIKDGNLSAGNRFKFIERTGNIEQHRGIKADDGLIRVSFQFEKVVQPYVYPHYTPGHWDWKIGSPHIGGWPYSTTDCCGSMLSANGSSSESSNMIGSVQANCVSTGVLRGAKDSLAPQGAPINDVGITVPGSKSDQKFVTVKDFPLEAETHVMILRLLGETETGKEVLTPVTVKTKPRCVTCGRQNKATSSFCSHCGTALDLI